MDSFNDSSIQSYGEFSFSIKNVCMWYKLFQEIRENDNWEPRSRRRSTSAVDVVTRNEKK